MSVARAGQLLLLGRLRDERRDAEEGPCGEADDEVATEARRPRGAGPAALLPATAAAATAADAAGAEAARKGPTTEGAARDAAELAPAVASTEPSKSAVMKDKY